MATIDQKVVEARFDSAQFERGVSRVIQQLQQLNSTMNLDSAAARASRGLAEINAAAAKTDLSKIANATEHVASKFNWMSAVATAAITRITFAATNLAGHGINKMTASIREGFADYELKLGATQTVMAGTGESIGFVSQQLKELDIYADETIYSLSDMVNNIGKFTNAGVKLPVAVEAMKGISNVAAISGAGTQEAAMAMYNLGQAIGQGTVRLMDWRSVELANMGTKEFKEQLIQSAEAMGSLERGTDGVLRTVEGTEVNFKTFTSSLQDQWLTSEALIDTLNRYSDTNTKIGRRATKAATQVKTFSMMMTTLAAAAGTGWTDTFELVLGNLPEATKMWTEMTESIGAVIARSADARNEMLKEWKGLGGRKEMILAVKAAVEALTGVIRPIAEAWREVFPPSTGKDLFHITVAIKEFFQNLKIGADTAEALKNVFKGIFSIFSIGFNIVKGVFGFLSGIFSTLAGGAAGGLTQVVGKFGEFIVSIDQALEKGEVVEKFFGGLSDAISGPLEAIKRLTEMFFSLFDFDIPSSDEIVAFFAPLESFGEWLNRFGDDAAAAIERAREPVNQFAQEVSSGWDTIQVKLEAGWTYLQSWYDRIAGMFETVGSTISRGIKGANWQEVQEGMRTGLYGGLLVVVIGFIKRLKAVADDAKGFIDTISGTFQQLTDTLQTMQTVLRAQILLNIAIAVGILAASVAVLAGIPAGDLAKATGAVSVLFAQVTIALTRFSKLGGEAGLLATSTGLIAVATAVRILAGALKELAGLSIGDVIKGMVAINLLIQWILGAGRAMASVGPSVAASFGSIGVGLILLSVAVRVLVESVEELSELGWEELAKGLIGVGTILGALGIFMKLSATSKMGASAGAGLLLTAIGIRILAEAVEKFGSMDLGTMLKGLVVVGAVLTAFHMFSKNLSSAPQMIAMGGALLLVSIGMNAIARALRKVGELSWEQIAKGLLGITVAIAAMTASFRKIPAPQLIAGGAAMLLVSYAMGQVADVLEQIGAMSWETLAKGMIGFGGSLLVLALAVGAFQAAIPGAIALTAVAVALSMFIPVFIKLSQLSFAELAMGLGSLVAIFLVLGLAALALAPAVPILAGLGLAVFALGAGLALVGLGAALFAAGLLAIAAAGAGAAIALVRLIKDVAELIPFIAKYAAQGIMTFITEIAKMAPEFFRAAVPFFLEMLKAARKITPKVMDFLLDFIVDLWKALEDAVPQMTRSAGRIILGILRGLQDQVPKVVRVIFDMMIAIINEIDRGIGDLVEAGADLIVNFIKGISDNLNRIIEAGADLIISFLEGISENTQEVVEAGFQIMIDFMNGLTDAINSNAAELREAGLELAFAIIDGMTGGLASRAREVASAAANMARGALSSAAEAIGAQSPSKEFRKLGKWSAEGFAQGLVGGKDEVIAAWQVSMDLLREANNAARSEIDRIESELTDLREGQENAKQLARIAKLERALVRARKERDATRNAITTLNKQYDDEERRLISLGKRYDEYTAKLERANQKLDNAIQKRDDYSKSIKDQFGDLPDISNETDLDTFLKELRYSNAEVALFKKTLAGLDKLGLSDRVYKDLLAQGVDALPLAEEILAGGKASVDQVNRLSKNLNEKASELGKMASKELYQAGVDSARGLVNGLKKKRKEIRETMEDIARSVAEALRKALKIKSPSQVTSYFGEMVSRGFADGIKSSANLVDQAVAGVGEGALTTLQQSISDLSGLILNDIDANPTITPILDLSAVTRGAATVGSLLSGHQMAIDGTYSKAAFASEAFRANLEAAETSTTADVIAPGDVSYIQNIFSPKAVSEAEVYRQTNNQLSRTKEALNATP